MSPIFASRPHRLQQPRRKQRTRQKRLQAFTTCAMLLCVRNVASISRKVHRTALGKVDPAKPWSGLALPLVAMEIIAVLVSWPNPVSARHRHRSRSGRCHLTEPTVLTLEPEETIKAAAMTSKGDLLAAGTDTGRIVVWSLPSGRQLFTARGPRRIEALAFSPDGTLLAAATARPGLRLWRLSGKMAEMPLLHRPTGVMALAFSPDGSILAFGGRGRTVGFYRIQDGTPPSRLATELVGPTSWVSAIAFSSDANTVYVGSWDDRVRAFDKSSTKQLWESHVHRFAINAMVVTPAGLAVSSDDGRISFHRLTDGRATRILKPGAVVAMAKTGRLLLGLTWERKLVFLDARRGTPRCAPRVTQFPRHGTWSLAAGGRLLAVGGRSGKLLLFAIPPVLLGQ